MIVVPQPMPDEMARSVLGRIIRLNGLGSRQSIEAVKGLRRVARIDTSEVGSTVGLIAHLLNRDPRDFVAHHTLYPWWIIVRLRNWVDADGRLRAASLPQTIQPQRPYVSLCPDCVTEDLQFHGFSYWRRGHQVDGAYECLKHGVGLRHYCGVDMVQTFPSEAMAREPLSVSSGLRAGERRFQRLFTDLGESQVSLSGPIAYSRLRRLAGTEREGSETGKARLKVQEKLEELFSENWMREVVPSFCKTVPETLSPGLEGFFRHARLIGNGYALALAIALLNRDEDVFELFASCPADIEIKAGERRRAALTRQALARSYIRHKGKFAAFLPEMGAQRETCRAQLVAMGLPDLDGQMLEAVRLLYTEDLSIAETIQRSGVELWRFEFVLKAAGVNLRQAIEQMSDQKGQSQRHSTPDRFKQPR